MTAAYFFVARSVSEGDKKRRLASLLKPQFKLHCLKNFSDLGIVMRCLNYLRCNYLLCLGMLLCCNGCGGKSPAEVTGKVEYQGATVESGAIRFYPLDKASGRGAAVAIEGGTYTFPSGKGLLAGSYKVSITADKLSGPNAGKIPKVRGEAGGAAEPVEYIPVEYNDASKLEVQIDTGANEKDFKLPTK